MHDIPTHWLLPILVFVVFVLYTTLQGKSKGDSYNMIFHYLCLEELILHLGKFILILVYLQ